MVGRCKRCEKCKKLSEYWKKYENIHKHCHYLECMKILKSKQFMSGCLKCGKTSIFIAEYFI